MTYHDIIAQIVRRLGYRSPADIPKVDIRYAIKWAESELIGEPRIIKKTHNIDIIPTESEYDVSSDYGEPHQLIAYDSQGVRLLHSEVEYGEWLKWEPDASSLITIANDLIPSEFSVDAIIENAKLSGRAVLNIRYTETGYKVSVKPAFTGKVLLYYSSFTDVNPFTSLDVEPNIPQNFQHYVVPGAVYYLAQIEAAAAVKNQDYNAANFFSNLQKSAFQEFELRKARTKEQVNTRSEPAVITAWPFYDNPRKYRRSR